MKKIFIILPIFILVLFTCITCSLAFGPSSTNIYNGIDLSQWQKEINFIEVKLFLPSEKKEL